MATYGIIGFGCAGYYGARTIRENDPDGKIIVFSEHGYAPYNPMLTTYYAAERIPFEGLFPFGNLEKIRDDLRLTLVTERKVKEVDCDKKTVSMEDGEVFQLDKLLIATGASAFAPRFEGLDPKDAFYMRTIDDAIRLHDALQENTYHSALVVGASMVGIKVVELLHDKGIKTTLADLAPRIFPLAAYESVSHEIEHRLEEKGITLTFNTALQKVEKTAQGFNCVMSDGSTSSYDMIVLCIGTRTNVSIVDSEQIKVNRGIVVDENMESSAKDVYSAGDCCEGNNLQSHEHMIIGLWANAAHQGATAGANMAGARKEFDGNFLHNITHFMNMDFVGFGDNRITGEVIKSGDIHRGLYVEAVLKDGTLAGVNILDNYRISGAVKNYLYKIMEGGNPQISSLQRGILIKEGLRPSFIEKLEGTYNG